MRECPQCQESGKNVKSLLRQKQLGKLPESKEIKQEIAIDFTGPFQNAIQAERYPILSIYYFSEWPEAKFSRKPITETVINVLKTYIARHGIPQVIRTDPVTICRSKRCIESCKK